MILRIAMLAPVALAAALPAQFKSLPAKQLPAPAAQSPTAKPQSPAEQLEQLNKEKARLEREIQYVTGRVQQAKSLLSAKLVRATPVFKSIDAGKPASAVPVATPRMQRKFARVGTDEEMNFGGNTAMVMVNGRAISQAAYDQAMNYLREANPTEKDALRAQKVLYDMIRIEAIASQFIENEGELNLSENLELINSGKKTFENAAKEFGTVQGATTDGVVEVTRNSILGPYFEYIAFSTEVGKNARPFRTTNGYLVLRVNSYKKGAQPKFDKVICSAVQFSYSADQKVMQDAQFKVNSGQVDVFVRDQGVLDLLPAMFKPAQQRMSPFQQIKSQIEQFEAELKSMGDADEKRSTAIKAKIATLRETLKSITQQTPMDADAAVGNDAATKPLKQAPIKKAPAK